MSATAQAAYRSRFTGRTSPAGSRKSPEIEPFYGYWSTFAGKAHCIKDSALLEAPVETVAFIHDGLMN